MTTPTLNIFNEYHSLRNVVSGVCGYDNANPEHVAIHGQTVSYFTFKRSMRILDSKHTVNAGNEVFPVDLGLMFQRLLFRARNNDYDLEELFIYMLCSLTILI